VHFILGHPVLDVEYKDEEGVYNSHYKSTIDCKIFTI
jgi:hypothetical protein